jgi:hypothetical protein
MTMKFEDLPPPGLPQIGSVLLFEDTGDNLIDR